MIINCFPSQSGFGLGCSMSRIRVDVLELKAQFNHKDPFTLRLKIATGKFRYPIGQLNS